MFILSLHFGGGHRQMAVCGEIENNFSLHQVDGGHPLHLWSHKSGGGEAVLYLFELNCTMHNAFVSQLQMYLFECQNALL